MKAAFINKPGDFNQIQWGDVPMPEIKDKQVLVKVSAVAASPVDTYIRAGKFPMIKPLTFPYIIGSDMVGTVSKVSGTDSKFKPGQRVWSNSLGINGKQGSFAEFVAVDEDLLYIAPDKVNDEIIVSAVQAGATACYGLLNAALLRKDEVIFINGGSGNVGSALIQIAKSCGAKVIATTSGPDKMVWCKSLGADLVVDYNQLDVEQIVKKAYPDGVNVFWDTSRSPNFDKSVSLLAKKGRIVLMAGAEARSEFPVGPFYRKQCSMKGFVLQEATVHDLYQAAELINMSLERGQLKTKIALVLPMHEAAKAHELLETKRDLWGKIVLKF